MIPAITALQARQDWRNRRLLLLGEQARRLNQQAKGDAR